MPTYWIAAIIVFFVYLLPMFYVFRGALFDVNDVEDVAFTSMVAVIASLVLGLFWPMAIVGTALFFVVRWLESVRVK